MGVLKFGLQYKGKVRDRSGSLSGPDCAYVPSAAAWKLSEGNGSKFTPCLFVSYDLRTTLEITSTHFLRTNSVSFH